MIYISPNLVASPSSFANVCEIMSLHYTPREGLERFLGKMERNDPVHIILMLLYSVPTLS
jgi:hypothetical protein